jgi:hypothetical protein
MLVSIVPVDYEKNLSNTEQKEVRHAKSDMGEL